MRIYHVPFSFGISAPCLCARAQSPLVARECVSGTEEEDWNDRSTATRSERVCVCVCVGGNGVLLLRRHCATHSRAHALVCPFCFVGVADRLLISPCNRTHACSERCWAAAAATMATVLDFNHLERSGAVTISRVRSSRVSTAAPPYKRVHANFCLNLATQHRPIIEHIHGSDCGSDGGGTYARINHRNMCSMCVKWRVSRVRACVRYGLAAQTQIDHDRWCV